MSLFPFRYIAILLVAVIGFSFYLGLLHWDHSKERCMVRRSYDSGSWHTWFAVGRLEFRVKDYDCAAELKLDPEKWKNNGFGQIVPVDNSGQE